MRIGFVELVLLLFIASITVGPNVALFVDRWLRRAQRTSAAAARRKAQLEAQAAIEREALMTRFRVASNIFALLMLAALAYGLLLRPIDTPPKAYTAPDVRQDTGAAQTTLSADSKDSWKLGGYLGVDCVRTRDGLVYAAAYNGAAMKKRQSDLVRTDGGHYAAILSVEGELTSFAFDADGDLWLTVVTSSGGALCRARHDSWGTSVEQVVTQIDGAPLGVLSAVETGPDGKVYFAVSTEAAAKNGLESALRTELIAHTGTGCVYVYDPSARTVEQVLGGVAGAAGLALSEDGRTLYVSDLGDRCIWSVDADARELTAGGKNCGGFVSGLPGYPGALALDEDGILYISYHWTRSGWLEKHADSTLLRGIALRAGENIQKKLFKLPADAPCAEAVDTADGSWKQTDPEKPESKASQAQPQEAAATPAEVAEMQPTEEESSISPEPPVFEKPEESAAAEPELQKTEEIWAEPEKAEADMAPLEQPLPAELPPEPEQKAAPAPKHERKSAPEHKYIYKAGSDAAVEKHGKPASRRGLGIFGKKTKH